MKVRKGKEQINTYKGIPVVIDWDDQLRYKGKLGTKDRFERTLGGMLKVTGILVIIVAVIWTFLVSAWSELGLFPPSTIQELLIWLGLGSIMYGSYLKRNRSEFAFNLEHLALSKLLERIEKGKVKEIEVDDYFSYSLFRVIEEDYYDHQNEFVDNVIDYVLKQDFVISILNRLGINPREFSKIVLEKALHVNTNFETHYQGLLTAVFNKAIDLSFQEINAVSFFFVFAEFLWKDVFLDLGVTEDEVLAMEIWLKTENTRLNYLHLWQTQSFLKPTGTINRAFTSRYSPTLEAFGEDFTHEAAAGDFVLSMGREQEMTDLINTMRRLGTAALLIGPSGVGKSHLLKHLAVRMVVEDVPKDLRDKRLVVFDFTRAFTESHSLDDFKVVLQDLFDELAKTKDVIVVLDEIEQLLNVRDDFKAEILNVLQNGIRNHRLQLIATTTLASYRRLVEPNPGFASLFEVIEIKEPTAQVALQVLIDQSGFLEEKHGVSVQVNALKQIVKLAPKYDYEKVMPDKAIDLLEESMLEAENRGEHFLTEDIVSAVVSRAVGTKVGAIGEDEAAMLMKLEDNLHKRIVGQDAAVKAVSAALRRARAGFGNDNQPISAFLFFGPTGVGKTEVSKTVAATYYGDEKLMIRLDMSEYQEQENLDRLIGRVKDDGEFIGGYLTEAVKQKPFSLILLDELEKANPKVLDLFLQILDEGSITDGAGRKISFANTIIVATSNAGSRQIAEMISSGKKYDEVNKEVQPILRTVFRVEFLNRFDKVIMFKPLTQIEVQEIARRMMSGVINKMLEQGIIVKIAEPAIQELGILGYDPVYGARQLKRAIQENIQDKIAELIVVGQLKSGKTVEIKALDDYVVTDG